jgi:RNA polymerase sigma-70 factor (ECF subfamily)
VDHVQASTMTDQPDVGVQPDDAVVARVLAGDVQAFETLMRRYNQRLFRAARAVLRDEAEAEDVVQDAWVRAYTHLRQFAGRASFATWVTRIAVHEAIARGRRRKQQVPLHEEPTTTRTPDDDLGAREMVAAMEAATDALPAAYRTVFVLRDLEGLSVAETAHCLDVPEATVKTRLHRARALMRARLDAALDVSHHGVFAFAGHRCDRIVAAVMVRIGRSAPPSFRD